MNFHPYKTTLLTLILLFLIIFVLLNCQQPILQEKLSIPLEAPRLFYPPQDTTNVDVLIRLSWSTPKGYTGEAVSYDIYFQAGNSNPEKWIADFKNNSCQIEDSLQFATKYYWKIVVKNKTNEQASSSIWSFTTRAKYNNRPYTPHNPDPPSGSTKQPIHHITLHWSGGDPDPLDAVRYKIFWGNSSPPLLLLSADLKDTICNVPLLSYDTQYYWQVLAKDIFGLQTAGPVWRFTTTPATFYFIETFNNYSINNPPPDTAWNFYGEPGTVLITNQVYWGNSGKSCKFIDNTNEYSCYLVKTLPSAISTGMIEFYWRVERKADLFGLRLYSPSMDNQLYLQNRGPEISIREGSLQYYDNTRNWQFIAKIDTLSWYKVRLVFDCSSQFYQLLVNDEIKIQRATWVGWDVRNIKFIYFMTFNNSVCSAGYLDEFSFYSGDALKKSP